MKVPKYAALICRLKASDAAGAHGMRHLPSWVGSCHLLVEGTSTWIYVEPRAAAEGPNPGQLVLDLPAARYMIEILDLETEQWISRESAAGGPLVAGLPFSRKPQLLRITRSLNRQVRKERQAGS